MAIRKFTLGDVFKDELYDLIAIDCAIEDYKLAYLLNKYLGINLRRKPLDLNFNKDKSTYSIYEWKDDKQLMTWNLASNICKTENFRAGHTGSLFETQEQVIKTSYLIPEYKTVNYFLKIGNDFGFSKEKFILNTILKIPQIGTAYNVDSDQLKSKNHLIFS